MDSYWALYDDYFHLETENFQNLDKSEIRLIKNKFLKFFPCDDATSYTYISLLLYLYNMETYNDTHKNIIDILFEDILFDSVERLVNHYEKKFLEGLKKIKRNSIKQKNMNKLFKKSADICVDSIQKVVTNFNNNRDKLTKLFKGRFRISERPSPPSDRRNSIRETLPNINEKDLIAYVSQYIHNTIHLELLYEVWMKKMKETYPETVCISKKPSRLIIPTHLLAEEPNIVKKNKISHKKQQYINLQRNKYKMENKQNLYIPIDELEQCNKDIFICHILIDYELSRDGHANSLVFDKNNKCIYRFEPHGVDEFTDDIINNELRTYYPELDNFEYIGTNKTCPHSREGVQAIEGSLNRVKRPGDYGGSGFCFIWSLIYLEYVIHYIDIYSPDEIHNYLIHQIDDLTLFIYRYTYRLLETYHQMIRDDYQFEHIREPSFFEEIKQRLNNPKKNLKLYYSCKSFDVNKNEDLENLYNILYDGFFHFDTFIEVFFDLSEIIILSEQKLNNIKKMLKALEDGSLYQKLKDMNSESKMITDYFLPKTIYYYRDIVLTSFDQYIQKKESYGHYDVVGANELKKLILLYFDLKYCLN